MKYIIIDIPDGVDPVKMQNEILDYIPLGPAVKGTRNSIYGVEILDLDEEQFKAYQEGMRVCNDCGWVHSLWQRDLFDKWVTEYRKVLT